MSHANNIPPARSKIAPTKNCATSRSDNAVRRGSKVNRVFSGECGLRETWRDGTRRGAKRRGETIKGRHTMRMCVSRDKNLESRVTRNWRCELTADLALIASRATRCVIEHVCLTCVPYAHAYLYFRLGPRFVKIRFTICFKYIKVFLLNALKGQCS